VSRARRGLTMRATATLAVAAIVSLVCMRGAIGQPVDKTRAPPRALKVLIVSMFEPEAAPWIAPLRLTESVPIAGLLPGSPALRCDGRGTYCTTQQEDNATYNALARAAAAGRVDLKRLAVLRTGSNFDRPHPGQSAHASLMASTTGATGGFVPATNNLYRAGAPLVNDIVARWPQWREGVPPP